MSSKLKMPPIPNDAGLVKAHAACPPLRSTHSGDVLPAPKHPQPESDLTLLRATIRALRPGQSFLWGKAQCHPYHAARQLGVKIVTRKISGAGFRIWRAV